MSNSLKIIIIAFIAAIVLTVFKGEKEVLFGPGRTDDSYIQNETIEETVTVFHDNIEEE